VATLKRHFPRWRRYLDERGVTYIPSPLSTDPADALVTNLLSLQVRQASLVRNPEIEHNLRNLVGVRPYKP